MHVSGHLRPAAWPATCGRLTPHSKNGCILALVCWQSWQLKPFNLCPMDNSKFIWAGQEH